MVPVSTHVLSECAEFVRYPMRSNHPAIIWECQMISDYVGFDRIYLPDLIGSDIPFFIGMCRIRWSVLNGKYHKLSDPTEYTCRIWSVPMIRISSKSVGTDCRSKPEISASYRVASERIRPDSVVENGRIWYPSARIRPPLHHMGDLW